MNIYWLFLTLFLLLVLLTSITLYLTLQVPFHHRNHIHWLWKNRFVLMIIRVLLILLVSLFSLLMYYQPILISVPAPLNQSGIFLFFISIMLLGNFVISPQQNIQYNYISHPLVFITAIIYLTFCLITEIVNIIKIYRLNEL